MNIDHNDIEDTKAAHDAPLRNNNYVCSSAASKLDGGWRQRSNDKPLTITRTNGERNEFI